MVEQIKPLIPAKAGEKRFKYEQKEKLVNPKITAEGKNVRGRGCPASTEHVTTVKIIGRTYFHCRQYWIEV